MKINVKNPAMLEKLAESAFNAKLKASMSKLEDASGEAAVPFLLRAEHSFQGGAEGTLLIVGLNNAWKKHVKSKGWLKSAEAKKTAVGICILKERQMEVVIQKGKMTKTIFQKAIKKNSVLKRFSWAIKEAFLEDDASLEEDENEDNSIEAELKEAEQTFTQLTKKYQAVANALKSKKEKAEKEKLLIARNKILKRIKVECKDWEELAVTADEDSKETALYQSVLKQYTKWAAFLKKLKDAKLQKGGEQETIELEEEQLYAKALNDVQNFNASLAGIMDVDVVEESIAKLEKHIKQWHTMTNDGQNAKLADDFRIVEEKYKSIQNGWAILKPILIEWHQYKDEIEALQEGGEALPEELINNFLSANERVQAAL